MVKKKSPKNPKGILTQRRDDATKIFKANLLIHGFNVASSLRSAYFWCAVA